jgi:hypothetical protein
MEFVRENLVKTPLAIDGCACEQYFWLASVHPLLEKQDLDDIVAAVLKVVTAFLDKKAVHILINYATPEIRARL